MNSPMVSSSSFDELQKLYRKLEEAPAKSDPLFDEAVQKGDIASLHVVTSNLRGIAERFKEEARHHFVELPDKLVLLKTEYEGLRKFATKNMKDIEEVLERVGIKDGSVVDANFGRYGLTTLSGLEALTRLQELNVSWNFGLGSLYGVPTARLRELAASRCSLTSIEVLRDAINLEYLDLNHNQKLHSLAYLPVANLMHLFADNCGLTSVEVINDARNLRHLTLDGNYKLGTLNGIATEDLLEVGANDCGLISIEALLRSKQLWKADIRNNSKIPKDQINKLRSQLERRNGRLRS